MFSRVQRHLGTVRRTLSLRGRPACWLRQGSADAKRARPLRDQGGRKSRGRALLGLGTMGCGRTRQLPLVVVLATVAGVAATAATVVGVVATVVLGVVVTVVAAVALEAEVAAAAAVAGVAAAPDAVLAVAPFDAPAAMQPVRTAATATPANPAARRARRAGCGRRRRAVVGVGGFVEVMSHMIEQLSGTILRTASIVALSSRDRW